MLLAARQRRSPRNGQPGKPAQTCPIGGFHLRDRDQEQETRVPPIVPPKRGGRGQRPPFDCESASEQERAEFDAWWPTFPNRVKRDQALKAFLEARLHASMSELIDGSQRYAQLLSSAKSPAPMTPANWLRHRRWLDEPFVPAVRPRSGVSAAYQTLADVSAVAVAALEREMALSPERAADPGAAAGRRRSPHQARVDAALKIIAARQRANAISGDDDAPYQQSGRRRSPHQAFADAGRRVAAAARRQMEEAAAASP